MAYPEMYLLLPGSAREALTRYRDVFGGTLNLNSYADFGRTDGPADAIAHGMLRGTVTLLAADAGPDEESLSMRGAMLSLLGAAAPAVLREWFDSLAEGGDVLDPLQARPWGDTDGQVVDRFGVRWLIGFEGTDA